MLQCWNIFCHCTDVAESFWRCLWLHFFRLYLCRSIVEQFDVAHACLHHIWCSLYPTFKSMKLPDHRRDPVCYLYSELAPQTLLYRRAFWFLCLYYTGIPTCLITDIQDCMELSLYGDRHISLSGWRRMKQMSPQVCF